MKYAFVSAPNSESEETSRMIDDRSLLPATSENFERLRRHMVLRQIENRGICQPAVLRAMGTVPRHFFVPAEFIARAYEDEPLPIGNGQTISQPFMVAAMAEALSLEGDERVLEIGAGSGYQAAVLSLLARDVTAVERNATLASAARERLTALGFANVQIEEADGSLGWSSGAPYDAILVTAGAPAVPPPLVDQLAENGRLVIPVGDTDQQKLIRIVKRGSRTSRESLYACRFVPLRGSFGWREDSQDSTQG
jgi:protein-L-isoaspartate(D-aspartate) O-methyltransferase